MEDRYAMHLGIAKLENPIRYYDWGSREFIARLQSRPTPSERPEAELWIGDHPRAPSRLLDSAQLPIPDLLRQAPEKHLGPRSVERFGPTLPFLVKVLAAARPLSIQVHPDAEQAERGFRAEEDRGLASDAPERSYPDPRRKIELMIALEPFLALCGFRSDEATRALLARVGSDLLLGLGMQRSPAAEGGHGRDTGIAAEVFFAARSLGRADRAVLLRDLELFAAKERDTLAEAGWVGRLMELHPDDPGVLAPLCLNLVSLAAGEALFVRPGTLHSYLSGSGVEVMSSSDNVVRGGLTPKHVDAEELLRLTRRAPLEPVVVRPVPRAPGVVVYELPEGGVEEFEVRVLSPHEAGGTIPRPQAATARVLLCVAGTARIAIGDESADRRDLELRAGEAAWVSAGAAAHGLRLGKANPVATVYEVTMR